MDQLLSNDIIALRALERADIDLLYKWENDSRLWPVSNNIAPYSREMINNYLETNSNDIYKTYELRLIATLVKTGEPLGTVDFTSFDPMNNRAELGLFVAPEFQGKGFGTQVLQLVKNYAGNCIGLRQLYVLIPNDNEVCLKLFRHEKFVEAGILKSWLRRGHNYMDVHILQYIF